MNPRTVLVKLDTVSTYTGKTTDEIFAAVDGWALFDEGFEWVFNLAFKSEGGRRDLRFWAGEVVGRSAKIQFPAFTLDQVLEQVLPITIAHFAPGRVCADLQIADNMLMKLRPEIGQTSGPIPRAKLLAFLRCRWIGTPAGKRSGAAA